MFPFWIWWREQHLCPLWKVFWVVGKVFEKDFHIEAEREMDSDRKTCTARQGKLQRNQSHSILGSGLTALMMDGSLGECRPPSGKTLGGHIHLCSSLRSLISSRLWLLFLECAARDGLVAQFMDLSQHVNVGWIKWETIWQPGRRGKWKTAGTLCWVYCMLTAIIKTPRALLTSSNVMVKDI